MTESNELSELRALARAFADEPAPRPGDIVPAHVLHDFAKKVLPYLLAADCER